MSAVVLPVRPGMRAISATGRAYLFLWDFRIGQYRWYPLSARERQP